MVESPPESHTLDMNDNNIFDDSTIDNEVDPIVDGLSAITAVAHINEQEITAQDLNNRYSPHSGRYHLRDRRKPSYGYLHHKSHDKFARTQQMCFMLHHVAK